MRRRQISNMHGGYRGKGVTLDWHTTYKPSMIQVEKQTRPFDNLPPDSLPPNPINKPLPPIVPPSTIQPPTIQPPPTTPPTLTTPPRRLLSDKAMAAIVGVSVASIAAVGVYANKEIRERGVRNMLGDIIESGHQYQRDREGLLAAQQHSIRNAFGIRREGDLYDLSPLGSDIDEEEPILINIDNSDPRDNRNPEQARLDERLSNNVGRYVAGIDPDINQYAFYDEATGRIIPRSGAERYFDVGL